MESVACTVMKSLCTCGVRRFWTKLIILSSMVAYVYPASPGISDKPVTLSSLPALVDKLIKAEPEKKSLDGEIIIAAHNRFIELLDPEKGYFLEDEIFPFLDPAKKKEYAAELTNGSYQSYKDMVEVFQKAIQRSREIRQKLQGKVFSEIPTEFPKTGEQLEAKVYWLFLASRSDRKRTVADLGRQEEEWSTCNEELLAQTILKSILPVVDVNSAVLGERDARAMREKLTKEAHGTGIICEEVENNIRIAQIQKGSPAAKKGLFQRGDILLSIDGKICQNLSLEEVDGLLREKDNGSVLIAWEGPAGERKEQIPLQSFILEEGRVQGEMHGNILVAQVPVLYSNGKGVSTTEDLAKSIKQAQQNGPVSGIILDLRDDGGGYLTEAISTCGLFIKTGVVMAAVYANGQKAVYRDTDPRVFFDGPVVILISERTASAAEIVAQTLKDYGKAIIVGAERSFGKGSIQMQTVTDAKGAGDIPLRYTVGKFYSVAGISPNGKGVKADILLPGFSKKLTHPLSAATLPERIPPLFHDTLNDIPGTARAEYQKSYIPYLQEKEYTYRKLIPLLREKSEKRVKKLSLQSGEQIPKEQLHEAENILEDLIERLKEK